jgi:hypothetical protein
MRPEEPLAMAPPTAAPPEQGKARLPPSVTTSVAQAGTPPSSAGPAANPELDPFLPHLQAYVPQADAWLQAVENGARRVRDLSEEEARDIALGLCAKGDFKLRLRQAGFKVTNDQLVLPPYHRQHRPYGDGVPNPVQIDPEIILGVQIRLLQGYQPASGTDGWAGLQSSRQGNHGLDWRFVVGLDWMVRELQRQFNITAIYTLGIRFASRKDELAKQGKTGGHGPDNCHFCGRAIDFAGVRMPDPDAAGQSTDLTVLQHWGKQKVYDPEKFDVLDNWPTGYGNTYYRLDATWVWAGLQLLPKLQTLPGLQPPANLKTDEEKKAYLEEQKQKRAAKLNQHLAVLQSPTIRLAARVFQAVYNHAARHWKDTDVESLSPTIIGARDPLGRANASAYIIHPDHKSQGLRTWHNNHFHIQLGPTDDSNF